MKAMKKLISTESISLHISGSDIKTSPVRERLYITSTRGGVGEGR